MSNHTIRTQPQFRTLGAIVEPQSTTFRVWAPEHETVELVICGRPAADAPPGTPDHAIAAYDMTRVTAGDWAVDVKDAPAGTLYKFRLDRQADGTYPDPASRYQPFGVHGPSAVIDPWVFRWTDDTWSPRPFDELSIYELHVGTFTPEGTFRGAMERLPALAALGVTAIEIMPVADFAGNWNWGYDGVALSAPARCYGTPDDLRALVDAAHALGLAVVMDVVYNHFGPDGAYANLFSPHYFTDAHESPWGRGVNLDGEHSESVRRFFIENAVHWVDEYHVDGLRLDATHALIDDTPRHFLAELTDTVRAHASRRAYFIAEDHRNLTILLRASADGGYGIDGVWADDFHHHARVHTAGDGEGYYSDFSGSTADLARTMELGWFYTGQYSAHHREARGTDPSALHPRQFVIGIQNHDQIGNRADGARLNHQIDPAIYRALSVLLVMAPETPMLFMGQEWAATTPFLFFTDHNAELGKKITEGRRREFKAFAAFADPATRETIPDPQSRDTFDRSRLNWSERAAPHHAGVLHLYARLLALRETTSALRDRPRGAFSAYAPDEHTVVLDYARGLLVVARIGGGGADVRLKASASLAPILTTEDAAVSPAPLPLSVESAAGEILVHFQRPGAIVLTHSGQ